MKSEFKVYDICEFSLDRQQDVIVSRFAVYLKNLKKLHFPHRHDFYHMILFTKGGGAWLDLMANSGCDALGVDWLVDLHRLKHPLLYKNIIYIILLLSTSALYPHLSLYI